MTGRRLMSLFWADPAPSRATDRIHPRLTSFTDEVCATVARIFAYVGTLALLAILGFHAFDQLQAEGSEGVKAKAAWNVASRAYPAFAVSKLDQADKSATYTTFRHPSGGRKDILRWAGAGIIRPAAVLEIYRPGGEFDAKAPPAADLAGLMAQADMSQNGTPELEAAGIIDSKFGTVALLRPAGSGEVAGACLGFAKRINSPLLEIEGISCQGDTLPARRAAISCMLNRLTLLAAGNEPKLADLFAAAELKRGSCTSANAADSAADWVSSSENPELRGAF
jgi:hypothetical protein